MPREYLLFFAQVLDEFRIPEIHSVCEVLNIKISYDHAAVNTGDPFMRAFFDSEADARLFATRCVLLKSIYELWAFGKTYEDVYSVMQTDLTSLALWQPYIETASFRFSIRGYNCTLSSKKQRDILESFSFMDYKGPIVMNNPDVEVCVWEDWTKPQGVHDPEDYTERVGVWIGKKIADGQRNLMDVFDLKKRVYIGNTSMAADLSLIMANQAKAGPSKLIYDPFVGTGSMLYTAAYFGARVIGSDIDGRHIRGKGKGIADSATQYGVKDRITDCLVFDLNLSAWRTGELFDAIVTDPPYGVRAGAKRQGRKDPAKLRKPTLLPDGTWSHERVDYIPPNMPWEMSEVLVELLRQSHYLLKPGGRLVYWLPTVPSEYQDSDVPTLKGLRLVSNSEQNFGKWARRLITMEKVASDATDQAAVQEPLQNGDKPAHYDFRTSYFAKPDRTGSS